MQHFLATDIISAFNRSKYGSAGDLVTVITEHAGVLIVEGPDNKRFAVMSIEIQINPDSSKTPVMLELIPLPQPKAATIPTLKQIKKTSEGQSSLF